MARILFDGIENYASANDLRQVYPVSAPTGIVVGATFGRFGGRGIHLGTGSAFFPETWAIELPVGKADLWVGFAFRLGSTDPAQSGRFVRFASVIGTEAEFYLDHFNRSISAYLGASATLLGTSAPTVVPFDAWCWLEFHYKLDALAGVMEVWIDGAQVLNLTGINTKANPAATELARVAIIGQATGGAAGRFVDDLYILDTLGSAPWNTRLGDCRIYTLVPVSDAVPNNGVPSTGSSHFAVVDESPGYNTTDFLTLTNTTGQEERFGIASLPSNVAQVLSVSVVNVANKSDAGAAFSHNKIVSGVSSANGASKTLSTSYTYTRDFFDTDPATASAWSVAAVNAAKIAYVVE